MPVGFGNEPPGRGPKGFRADQPPSNTADDLHAIRERFCGPPTMNPQVFSLAANQTQKFDLTGTAINAVILTTATGQANLYLGDFTSGNGRPAPIPHYVGSAAIAPNTEVFPVAPNDNYIITIQEGTGASATGTITFLYQ